MKVQWESYAQITDGHFERFNNHPGQTQKSGTPGGTVGAGNDGKRQEIVVPPNVPLLAKHEKTPKTLSVSGFKVAAAGLEPATPGL